MILQEEQETHHLSQKRNDVISLVNLNAMSRMNCRSGSIVSLPLVSVNTHGIDWDSLDKWIKASEIRGPFDRKRHANWKIMTVTDCVPRAGSLITNKIRSHDSEDQIRSTSKQEVLNGTTDEETLKSIEQPLKRLWTWFDWQRGDEGRQVSLV